MKKNGAIPFYRTKYWLDRLDNHEGVHEVNLMDISRCSASHVGINRLRVIKEYLAENQRVLCQITGGVQLDEEDLAILRAFWRQYSRLMECCTEAISEISQYLQTLEGPYV